MKGAGSANSLSTANSPNLGTRRMASGTFDTVADNDSDQAARALFEAVNQGDANKTRVLLSSVTDASGLLEYKEVGYSSLQKAAGKGHVECLLLLIGASGDGPADVNVRASGGFSPLHDAARNGHVKCVQILLDAGADVNARHAFGGTPLHCASAFNQPACVEVLLTAGADPFAKTNDGKSALDTASSEEIRALLMSARGEVKVGENATAAELEYHIKNLQSLIKRSAAEIKSLHGQLTQAQKRTVDLELQLHEARTQSTRDNTGLVQVLGEAGWRLRS